MTKRMPRRDWYLPKGEFDGTGLGVEIRDRRTSSRVCLLEAEPAPTNNLERRRAAWCAANGRLILSSPQLLAALIHARKKIGPDPEIDAALAQVNSGTA